MPSPQKARSKGSNTRHNAEQDATYEDDRRPQSPRTPTSTTSSNSASTPRAKLTPRTTFAANIDQDRGLSGSDPVPEVNLVILGANNVGKSTLIRNSFDLSVSPATPIVAKHLQIEGSPCLVRLIELSVDNVKEGEEGTVAWPDTVGGGRLPIVHGVMTLYDVSDKASFDNVPEVLNAIDKTTLPSMLVSCKCDIDPPQRQLDPYDIEQRAKAVLGRLITLHISDANAAAQKQAVTLLIKAVSSASAASRNSAATRRRTLSSAAQSHLGRSTPRQSHARASSDFSALLNNDVPHTRHDSSIGAESGAKDPAASDEDMHRSFLNLDESQDSASVSESGNTSLSEEDQGPSATGETSADERGSTFNSLVDRLLLLPKTKADSRFRAIFLALYRKFAAPGQLLEAIVIRFEALESADVAFMSRTVSQLRYLSIIEQWIGTYPGDFAHPRTRRRMRTFVSKLSNTRIFAAAAREMSVDLEVVTDDDDTDWACSDKDREQRDSKQSSISWPSKSSSMLDDPELEFNDTLNSLSLDRVKSPSEISSVTHSASLGLLHTVDLARKQAQTLTPVPRMKLDKNHWRTLMEMPTELIARELTRIDWIMFSAIRPRDFVRHVSLPAAEKATCKALVHVNRMIDHFNHLRDWVANVILLRDKAKHRVLMLEKLMQVARRLRDLNNYNSLGAFLAGINSVPVHRLNATRELLTPETQKDWMKLQILMAPTRSYSSYRLAWENSSGERIPFVPLPLRDLVGSQEGNKTFVGSADEKVNWQMFEVMGEVVVGIQKAQGQPYRNLTSNARQDELRAIILNTGLIKDDEALYERSVQLEPSNSSDRRGIKEFFKRNNIMAG